MPGSYARAAPGCSVPARARPPAMALMRWMPALLDQSELQLTVCHVAVVGWPLVGKPAPRCWFCSLARATMTDLQHHPRAVRRHPTPAPVQKSGAMTAATSPARPTAVQVRIGGRWIAGQELGRRTGT